MVAVANRREEKERLRQIREEAEQREASEQRRKLLLGYLVAGVLGLAVLGSLVFVIVSGGGNGGGASGKSFIVNEGVGQFTTTGRLEPDVRDWTETKPGPLASAGKLGRAAKEAGCVLESPQDEGNQHIDEGQSGPDYKSNPPTSGTHSVVPLANGTYTAEAKPENYLHTLEHGRVGILYDPKLPEADQLELKGVVAEDPRNLVLFPHAEMPYEAAAVAWGQLLGCKRYAGGKTLDAIRAFRDSYRDRGPEPATVQPS